MVLYVIDGTDLPGEVVAPWPNRLRLYEIDGLAPGNNERSASGNGS